MVRAYFASLLVAAILSTANFAESERRMTVSAEPVKAVHGIASLLFQHKISDMLAITVPGYFGTNWVLTALTSTMSTITDDKFDSSLLLGGGGVGARFFAHRKGMTSGFFAEPRVVLAYSKYNITKDSASLIDSKRLTIMPVLLAGYSWYFENGFYLSTGLEISAGFHAKNDIKVDPDLKQRLKDKYFLRNRLWADEGRWRFDYGYDISLGYAW